MTTNELLEALAGGGWVSGQKLAERFGVSRAAVWKHMSRLKEAGCDIEGWPAKGYRLVGGVGALGAMTQARLTTDTLGRRMIFLPSADSTNLEAKRRAPLAHGTVILAGEQTGGKGRLGRAWVSEHGAGLYMTAYWKPTLPPQRVPALTVPASVAVLRAMRAFGVDAGIKWPNDILAGGKKLCGILLEMSTDMAYVEYALCGIGVNVCKAPGIDTAISMDELLSGGAPGIAEVAAGILNELEPLYNAFERGEWAALLEEYTAHCLTLNRSVRVQSDGGEYTAQAVGIDRDGALNIERDGVRSRVLAGEVSVRGMMGYV